MVNDNVEGYSSNRDYEKKIENFAKATLKEVETKSKMLGITVKQVAGAMNTRKYYK